jgi:hypothetical protein
MLALDILASLAVNVAQGWSHGLVGAVVAAWPAVSLVGSYELLAWMVRTAAASGPGRVPAPDHGGTLVDHREPLPDHWSAGPDQADRESGPPGHAAGAAEPAGTGGPAQDVNAAAAAAYRASVQAGSPLSERRLAGMFGKTSQRWARGRMAEARQVPA